MRRPPVIVVVMAIWCLSWAMLFFCVRPASQNFPLLDDFSFTRGALRFARGEGIHYDGWPGIPLLGQWVWAYPFVWVFGENHLATRLSTLVLAGLALISLFSLIQSEGVSPHIAAFVTAALGFNPWFYVLSGSYMSDVPSLSFCLIAFAFLRKGLEEGKAALWGVGAIAATLAAINRQNMVAVPISALALLLWRYPKRRTMWWLISITVPIISGLAVAYWFGHRADVQTLLLRIPGRRVLDLGLSAAHTIGLSVLPACVLLPEPKRSRVAMLILLASCLMLLASLHYGTLNHLSSLVLGNVITTRGAFSSIGGLDVGGGRILEIVLLLGGYAGIAFLIARAPRMSGAGPAALMLLIFGLLQILPLLVAVRVYDRYMLVLLPAALCTAVAGCSTGRPRWAAGLVLLSASGLASVGITHDLLELNRARWELGRRAVATGISPTDIDGGFEWTGWFDVVRIHPSADRTTPQILPRYRITPAQSRSAEVVDSEPYQLWLSSGTRRLFLLE